MRTDLRFPVPEGRAWETFCNKQKCGLIDLHEENVETAKYLTELELQGVQCEVYLDFEVYKLCLDLTVVFTVFRSNKDMIKT